MILKGNQRAGGRQLSIHLLNVEDNEHVELHEVRGFIADDLHEAFKEAYALSKGTRCKQFLFSLSLNPPESEDVPIEAFEKALADIEVKLGLVNQPRAIVFHEKEGRRHAHCVWSRIDIDTMTAINLPHYKRKLNDISRQLFLEHGWKLPDGFLNKESRDLLSFEQGEHQQAKRTRQNPKILKSLFQRCWNISDSRAAFAHALKEHGFILARGDRRGHVAVDQHGEVYPISRWVGIKAKVIRERLGGLDDLPSVEEAKALIEVQLTDELHDQCQREQSRHDDRLDALNQKRQALVSAHRQARQDLKAKQESRRIAENHVRSSSLPTGLKALWAGMTGQYKRVIEENIAQARRCDQRDRQEKRELIRQQLRERQTLQHDIVQVCHHRTLTQKTLGREIGRVLPVDPSQPLILPPAPDEHSLKVKIQQSPERILEVITDKEETFTRNDVARALAKYIDEPAQLNAAIYTALHSKELVEVEATPEPRYSTKDMQQVKETLMDQAKHMIETKGHGVPNHLCRSAIRAQNKHLKQQAGASLSEEQSTAIHHLLDRQQLSIAVGLAGAGKSTMLAAAHHAWKKQGRRVIGAALSGKAADGLEHASGIESRTLASWELSWKNGYHQLQKGDVLVIDEAGMVGTRQMARFVQEVNKQGAKLVLVGDPEQLQPIQAGTPLKDLVQNIGSVELSEIRRQKSAWQRQASLDFARHRTDKALEAYEKHGAIHSAKDQSQAITALVEDYMIDLELHGSEYSRLALAHRRIDAHKINQTVRAARQSGGELQEEVRFKTAYGPRTFAKGDRIVFTRNNKELGVRNGSLGTITETNKNTLTVRFDHDSGKSNKKPRTLTFSPKHYTTIDHGYATTIHKSQGATVDRAFVLASKSMDRHLTYVAMTRHRHEVKLYADCSYKPRIFDRETLSLQPHRNRPRASRRLY